MLIWCGGKIKAKWLTTKIKAVFNAECIKATGNALNATPISPNFLLNQIPTN